MDSEEEILALSILILGIYVLKKQISFRWTNRKYWVRPINMIRSNQGDFHHLLQEMKNDSYMFFRYTRMSTCIFYQLLELLTPFLVKKSHRALVPEQGYLCEGFWSNWNLPNCCGAVDGKHVQIQAPPNSGTTYFNYKKTFSIILMAACDHKYKFTLIDVGEYGSNSDGGVFSRSKFGEALYNGNLNLPRGKANLPGSATKTPCFFVGDEAFKLTTNMMRPYSGRNLSFKRRVFNYRLSRARKVIENAFGILVSRWRILRKSITLHPKNVDRVILATICLHNFLKTVNDLRPVEDRIYCPPNFIDTEQEDGTVIPGTWRNECSTSRQSERLRPTTAHRATTAAYKQRDELADYLTSTGQVPWQNEYVNRGLNGPDLSE